MFNKIKLLSLLICFMLTKIAFAEMTLSGYQEFTMGSADQSLFKGSANHGLDKAGLDNGQYTRIDAQYTSKLDNGLDITGSLNVSNRDCAGDLVDNCEVTNMNFVTISGNFGSISVGERFAAGAMMLSRMTASGPTAEPDGALYASFYSADDDNTYGGANEVNYAANNMKVLYASNVISGFSFAASYTPNSSRTGLSSTNNGQQTTGSTWSSYNDLLSVFGKYSMEMDGIGLELVYGQQTGNAGQVGTNAFNDLDETAYSAKVTYGNFAVDYRKNEAGNSGQIKNNNAGGDEGTSICGEYGMGNMRFNACQVETSFTDTSNQSNSSETTTYAADYSLGGGVTLGLVYFDVEQVANGADRTDVDGLMSILMIGF